MEKLRDTCTSILTKIIKEKLQTKSNPIFVFVGLSPYIESSKFEQYFVDQETFNKEGNVQTFTKEWFATIFTKLIMPSKLNILSHQQFAYLLENLVPEFFQERVIIIYDNLRTLYPLAKDSYLEETTKNGLEIRSNEMPVYQAEQYKIGSNYYYSLRKFNDLFEYIPFFNRVKDLKAIPACCHIQELVDIISNTYAIDLLLNNCISQNNFSKYYLVKISNKNLLNNSVNLSLKQLNYFLSLFGGEIYVEEEEDINKNYTPSDDALNLLHRYWGDNAKFRTINVYKNPERNNTTIPISQGLIVDKIIEEYKFSKEGKIPRDIFVTAPTGAGKSLLFQLPAFYAADKGDITIVVSPLKALMNDQVYNLQNERHYNRVAFINSDLTLINRETIITDCKNGDIDILYLSPELLLSYDITYFIGDRKLGILVIDEAHLITTWGRDFRVDYWFLGNHINKIRKYSDYKFPLVALTATAVYGGLNDMVFDSISSLNMFDPHKFIGEVKRNDIEFVIDTHDDYSEGKYDVNKEKETIEIIKGINDLNLKAIIYVPYTRHVENLKNRANEINPNMLVTYHGSMNQDEQKLSYQNFKNNVNKIMVSTKAFGMGVDIPDIQLIYHHAPSGLLPDYIQEIGRAARQKNIHGYAAVTFSVSDLRYSNQLFGMSSLKTFQLQEVLKKIYRTYISKGKKRNMLISANDFGYIFNSTIENDQKISTALMMLEKDYLIKTRFNVLIARPKKMFAKVYAYTTFIGLKRLKEKFGGCFTMIPYNLKSDYNIIELNLDKIWSEYFSDRSFPQIKKDFYSSRFLLNEGIELTPQIKVIQQIDKSYEIALIELETLLNGIKSVFSTLYEKRGFFKESDFRNQLAIELPNLKSVDKISSFILSTYSGFRVNTFTLESDSFLQRRIVGRSEEYQIFNTNYEAKVVQLIKMFTKLFVNSKEQTATRYLALNDIPLKNQIRLGSILEIMGLGSYKTLGGEDPKLFIRINDPYRIKKDSENKNYKNYILESVKNKHKSSCEIFKHFFTHYLDNETRWNFIEDFFLGTSNDDLMSKYPGGTRNHIDILKYLKDNVQKRDFEVDPIKQYNFTQDFKPKENEYYNKDSLLTIENKTLAIKHWVTTDPVLLHRTIVAYNIVLDRDYYHVLISRLENEHRDYFKDFMGLKLYIQYPENGDFVQAKVPYKDDPVGFYKWLKKNKTAVALTYAEELQLYLNVEKINPKVLLKKHRLMIRK